MLQESHGLVDQNVDGSNEVLWWERRFWVRQTGFSSENSQIELNHVIKCISACSHFHSLYMPNMNMSETKHYTAGIGFFKIQFVTCGRTWISKRKRLLSTTWAKQMRSTVKVKSRGVALMLLGFLPSSFFWSLAPFLSAPAGLLFFGEWLRVD